MESESAGSYVALVVRLEEAADGRWYVHVDGTDRMEPIPLMPLTLVVRLWRAHDTGALRGTIRREGGDQWAPVQTNSQLEDLVRAWLFSGGAAGVQ